MKSLKILAVAALSGILAGCGSDTASFMVDGNDKAVTLERIKEYPWSDWELELVVRNNPDCQRRHRLKPTSKDGIKVELYTPEPYVFIVRQGKRWYVTEMKSCQLQLFKEEPPLPGTLIGSFREKDGTFSFVPEDKPAARQ
jgi:hypothetical protein